mmetsp:Transcript_104783/g.327917  ORF Transcript_104783/g.327917 Transcript_104783/m.327917 type:complete len:252 (-) Transcript_104783:228-983(-)
MSAGHDVDRRWYPRHSASSESNDHCREAISYHSGTEARDGGLETKGGAECSSKERSDHQAQLEEHVEPSDDALRDSGRRAGHGVLHRRQARDQQAGLRDAQDDEDSHLIPNAFRGALGEQARRGPQQQQHRQAAGEVPGCDDPHGAHAVRQDACQKAPQRVRNGKHGEDATDGSWVDPDLVGEVQAQDRLHDAEDPGAQEHAQAGPEQAGRQHLKQPALVLLNNDTGVVTCPRLPEQEREGGKEEDHHAGG